MRTNNDRVRGPTFLRDLRGSIQAVGTGTLAGGITGHGQPHI